MSLLSVIPSADTFISKSAPTTNFGGSSPIQVWGKTDVEQRALLSFDFSALPLGAKITAAILSLYFYGFDVGKDPAGANYTIMEILRTGWTELGSTWNKYDGTNAWTTGGGEDVGTDISTTNQVATAMPASFGWVTWDMTNMVKHFQADTSKIANFYLYHSDVLADKDAFFYSREYATDTTKRPKLEITYSMPAPQIMIF